jgi:HEXXH motif-containing protein
LVDRHLPLLGEELRLLLRLVVPVGWHAERHLSASYQEAIGLIYLTLHPQPMTMAEALVHEFQHNKINAVFHLDPLLHNAWQPRYSSPVRPDPRPLHGVILAVHAFQPVAQLYAAMADAGHELAAHAFWNERFRRILQLDRQGAATVLAHAQPTTVGAAFFAEMRQVDTALAQLEAQRWGDDRQMGGDLDELAGHD